MRGEDFVEVLGKNRHEPVEEPSEDQPKKNRSESVVRRTGTVALSVCCEDEWEEYCRALREHELLPFRKAKY